MADNNESSHPMAPNSGHLPIRYHTRNLSSSLKLANFPLPHLTDGSAIIGGKRCIPEFSPPSDANSACIPIEGGREGVRDGRTKTGTASRPTRARMRRSYAPSSRRETWARPLDAWFFLFCRSIEQFHKSGGNFR